jgi:hypothetical protein
MASAAEDCFAKSFAAYLPGYRSREIGGGDLLAKTRTALLQALQIVEDLPRTHWVWQPGYAIQTVNPGRLRDFCAFRLREDPSDELALWVSIGFALQGHRPAFGQEAFERLMEREGFDVSWPVHAACFVQSIWTSSSTVGLGAFLRQTGLRPAAEPLIAALRECRDPYVDIFEIEEFSRKRAAECLEIALW